METAPRGEVRLGYRPALDGLRAIAVLMVMGGHFGLPFLPGGFLGVDLFFVLSGFLITALLVEEWNGTGKIRLRDFYARRGLRLLPAVLVFLAVTAPFVTSSWTLAALLYVCNWGIAYGWLGTSPISHLWSLSVEEQFYFLWPPALLLLLRLRIRPLYMIVVVLGLAFGSAAQKVLEGGTATWQRLYHGSDTRADALLIGCALGLALACWGLPPLHRRARAFVGMSAAAGTVFIAWLAHAATIDKSVLYAGGLLTLSALSGASILLFILAVPRGKVAAALAWGPLAAVGRISYGLYLWHHAVAWLPNPWLLGNLDPVSHFVFRVTLSFLLAGASWFAIERPALRWKRRFERVRGLPVGPSSPPPGRRRVAGHSAGSRSR